MFVLAVFRMRLALTLDAIRKREHRLPGSPALKVYLRKYGRKCAKPTCEVLGRQPRRSEANTTPSIRFQAWLGRLILSVLGYADWAKIKSPQTVWLERKAKMSSYPVISRFEPFLSFFIFGRALF